MYEKELTDIGLSEQEIAIYSTLLKDGDMSAKEIADHTDIQRTYVYRILDDLIEKGIVEKGKVGKKTVFTGSHPSHIQSYIRSRQQELRQAELSFEAILPQMSSEFVLNNNRPGIHVYEGEEEFKKVLYHSLKTEQTIYTFVDREQVDKHPELSEINAAYVKERIKRKISKKMIMTDTPSARESKKKVAKDPYTEIRLISKKEYPFSIGVEIYDTSTSFLTYSEDSMLSVLVEHPGITEFQRTQFEFFWNNIPE